MGRRLVPAGEGVSAAPSRPDATLPPDLEQALVRRLGHVCLVAAASSAALGLVPRLLLSHAPQLMLSIVPGVVVSLLVYAAVASGRISVRRLLALRLVYQVVLGFFMAVDFHSAAVAPSAGGLRGWTPVAVWIIVFPLMNSAATRRTVVATLATAAMDPLGLWVSGAARGSWSELGSAFLPTLLATVIAPIAARIVYGLTVEVGRARRLGSYRLVEKLGEGGMGEVWRARHRMLARSAAIKLIRTSFLGDATRVVETLKRFEREARATAALRSPHTIVVYDFGRADGLFYYVMELLEGFSLQTLVDRFGPVPPERAVRLLRQACHSLAEAHAAGLVHRDIKPANLFVCRLGLDVDFVKVLDFGLVKVPAESAMGAEALTGEFGFAGTPGYMAPEAAVGAEVDRRADIYALGCVGYWLLTGRRVFESGNPMQVVVDHVRTPAVPPSQRGALFVPPGLEQIILRCLEKDPARRPATAVELSHDLAALDIESLWTEARARAWWNEHPPVRVQQSGTPSSLATPTRSLAVA
jgi:serine/threonine-protein kinase